MTSLGVIIHIRKGSVLLFVFGGANVIQSEMRLVYGDKCFMRPALHVQCKKFARGHESVVDEEEPGRRVVSTTDSLM